MKCCIGETSRLPLWSSLFMARFGVASPSLDFARRFCRRSSFTECWYFSELLSNFEACASFILLCWRDEPPAAFYSSFSFLSLIVILVCTWPKPRLRSLDFFFDFWLFVLPLWSRLFLLFAAILCALAERFDCFLESCLAPSYFFISFLQVRMSIERFCAGNDLSFWDRFCFDRFRSLNPPNGLDFIGWIGSRSLENCVRFS